MTFDAYSWIKALHVVSVMTFVGGMLGVAIFLYATDSADIVAARRVRVWDQRVTTPAMLCAWALGLWLGLRGDWFREWWLVGKLVLVVALSALHGIQSGKLRTLAGGRPDGRKRGMAIPLLIVASVAAVVVLVIVKPSLP